jgi:hypothetical protein
MHGKAFRWGHYQNLMLSLAATSGSHLILPLSALSLPLIYICCWKLMKSVGTDGSLSLPFVRKVMVGYFVNDTYKVTAALLFVVSLLVQWN